MEDAGYRPVAPCSYRLRCTSIDRWIGFAAASELDPVDHDGDVLLVRAHAFQPHLLIAAPGGAIHAHAGLRKVTFIPAPLPWAIEHQWRLRSAAH
jgi:hypothetical protein